MIEGPVKFSMSSDRLDEGLIVIRAEQTFGGVAKRGAWLPLTVELANDTVALQRVINGVFDRMLRPWAYPDRPWHIRFDPFPRWTRFAAWVRERREP